MTTTIRTTQLSAHVGQPVRLRGWVHALRLLGGINFLVLRDGWGTVQAVTQDAADFAPLTDANLAPETVIELTGTVVAAPQAPGGIELHSPVLTVITPVDEALPVNKQSGGRIWIQYLSLIHISEPTRPY